MFDIVTVGHFALDLIKLPTRSEAKMSLGGPPTYTSLAARRLGADVSVISKIGEDFPLKYGRRLRRQGVDLSGLKRIEGTFTTSFTLNYEESGRRHLILKNRAPLIEAEDIPDRIETKAVHIAPIANEISPSALVRLLSQASLVSLDPQGFLRHSGEDGSVRLCKTAMPEILERVDVFKSSLEEIRVLTGRSDVLEALRRISKYGARVAIVTKGGEGSLLYNNGRAYRIPAAKPRTVVDTTGAGDVLIGAFLAEYVHGEDLVWCGCVGSASASFVIEKPGPRRFGNRKEVYERAVQVYEETCVVK